MMKIEFNILIYSLGPCLSYSTIQSMKTIGNYTVIENLGGPGHNYLRIKLNKSQRGARQSQHTAIIQLLSNSHHKAIRRGQVSTLINNSNMIKELLFVNCHDRMYLATIFEENGVRANMQTTELKLTQSDSFRIVVEALLLIEDLHRLGVYLGEQLKNLLQVGYLQGQTRPSFSMLKINNTSNKVISGLAFARNKHDRDEDCLTVSEIIYLNSFLRRIQQLTPQKIIISKSLRKAIYLIQEPYSNLQAIEIKVLLEILWNHGTVQEKKTLEGLLNQRKYQFLSSFPQSEPEEPFKVFQQNKDTSDEQTKDNDYLEQQQGGQIQLEDSYFDQMDHEDYPGSCVVKIISCLKVEKRGRRQVGVRRFTGVGFLVSPDLVVTSAHLVYPKLDDKYYAVNEVTVITGSKKVKVSSYRFPGSFRRQRVREKDYALLHLEQRILLPRYLQIAKDYQTTSQIQIIKLMKKSSFMGAVLESTLTATPIQNRSVFDHKFMTSFGDTGSPIVVQLKELPTYYFVIAIHSARMGHSQKRISTKFTSSVVDNLVAFEKHLTSRKVSRIQQQSINYEQLLQKINNIAQSLTNSSIYPEQALQHNRQQIIQPINAPRKPREELQNLFNKYIAIITKWPQLSPQVGTLEREKQELSRCLQSFKEDSLLALLPDNQSQWYITQIDGWLNHLKNDTTNNPNVFQNWQKIVRVQYFKFRDLNLQWQKIAVLHKFLKNQQEYRIQKMFVYKQTEASKMLQKYIHFSRLGGDLRIHSLVPAILQTNYSLNRQHSSQVELFQPSAFRPFGQFQCNGFYQMNGDLKLYQFEYVVQLLSEEQLFHFCWQQIKFKHKHYPFTYLERVIDSESGSYALKIKLKSSIRSNLSSFMLSCCENYTGTLITLLLSVSDFIASLHSQGLILGSPLQFCLLAEANLSGKAFKFNFIYFGHPSALSRKFKHLLEYSSEEYFAVAGEYYPIREIMNSREQMSVKAFQKMDVWMLGKTLNRLLAGIPSNEGKIPELEQVFISCKSLYNLMTCQVEKRITIQQVKQRLAKIAEYLRNLEE